MKTSRIALGVALCFGAIAALPAQTPGWEQYLDQVRIKKVIADQLTPEQLEERRIRLAQWLAERAANAQTPNTPTGGPAHDTCPTTPYATGAFPFSVSDTTVGLVDDYDLPADTIDPTCTAPTTCTGAGPAGSLPRGAIYTGTGTGADAAYKIRTDANCTLQITVDPTSTQDLAAILYQTQCSSSLADCGCVDDTGAGGTAEVITLNAVAGTDYFVSADGYSSGGTPPGPSGPYTVSVAVTSGTCNLTGGASADLSITKTDGVASVTAGTSTTYTIVASNAGPSSVTGATVADTFPASCTSVSWSCVAAGGATCTAAGTGNINDTVNLPMGGTATYSATCAVSVAASGTLTNTATITGVGGVAEVNPANNTATDSDTIVAPALSSTPTSGTTTTFATTTVGQSAPTATITFNNPGPAPVVVSCSAPAPAVFSASPLSITVPATGSNSTSVTFSPTAPGPVTGSMVCTAGAQTFNFPLEGTGRAAIVVPDTIPSMGEGSRWVMILSVLALGLLAFAGYSRRQ
jgi:uncharacterized repeat protein (TIGR01451 family)